MSNLILMRHAESILGKDDIYSGTMDIPLTSNGVEQAIITAKHLPEMQYDVVFTSNLIRSIQTALLHISYRQIDKYPICILNHELDNYLDSKFLPILRLKELNERNYGVLQGISKKEAMTLYNEEKLFIWRRSLQTAPPHGESLLDIIDKLSKFYENQLLPLLEDNKNILIVAHQNSLRALSYLINPCNKEIEEVEFYNCTMCHYVYKNNELSLINRYEI